MPNVGAVGATGSWESHSSYSLDHQVRRPLFRQLLNRANRFILKQNFSPFPNYHLRPNAFMASRDLLLKISVPLILTKQDAHRFESGVKGFTRQILDMNKRVLVIGRDGQFYEKENWSSLMLKFHFQTIRKRSIIMIVPSEKEFISLHKWGISI